ncbi:hypothetical protein L6164_032217 [Bauhinia variegata]|uniref:Uncharacterized protein n=1 Tax=Bauhinia variegata TaxID=167791 RepID=A0ACB9KN72_BAUVA|nr:hypothetical protein L6164_032217 [Bauhinia variegata]
MAECLEQGKCGCVNRNLGCAKGKSRKLKRRGRDVLHWARAKRRRVIIDCRYEALTTDKTTRFCFHGFFLLLIIGICICCRNSPLVTIAPEFFAVTRLLVNSSSILLHLVL